MSKKRLLYKAKVQTVTLEDWMISCGVFLDTLVQDMQNSDAIYGENWIEMMMDQAHLINRVGRAFYDENEREFKRMYLILPADIKATREPNPHYDGSTEEPSDDTDGSSRDGLGDLPF